MELRERIWSRFSLQCHQTILSPTAVQNDARIEQSGKTPENPQQVPRFYKPWPATA
jgi:hypothetical protein